ncbi:MAG TPA: lysophospholipid acyltransferase family protein [Gemmatimonadales bacterium]|nr:lysophospholipid acyltransferase family protein [Gemmatimonadales bacterium]
MTVPLPVIAPKTPEGLLERIANGLLRLIRWRVVGTMPQVPKSVVIVAPHTSNWDLPIGLVLGFASGLLRQWPYGFMMKHTVFRWPVAGLMRAIGGLPIDRSRPHDIVPQMADELRGHERFLLVITPEGTRKRTEYWRSGFYHIAAAAGVPIIPVTFDYPRRECRMGEPIHPSGNLDHDLMAIRRFYQGATAKRPEKAAPIRFRDVPEEQAPTQ